jgi:hypothetical protein
MDADRLKTIDSQSMEADRPNPIGESSSVAAVDATAWLKLVDAWRENSSHAPD